ncbi:hypothetical protein BC826DRAFT_359200 [Russula brevipes]|nr:hypothetical protein BC826DRAFT_359200 [Russula brevipes]
MYEVNSLSFVKGVKERKDSTTTCPPLSLGFTDRYLSGFGRSSPSSLAPFFVAFINPQPVLQCELYGPKRSAEAALPEVPSTSIEVAPAAKDSESLVRFRRGVLEHLSTQTPLGARSRRSTTRLLPCTPVSPDTTSSSLYPPTSCPFVALPRRMDGWDSRTDPSPPLHPQFVRSGKSGTIEYTSFASLQGCNPSAVAVHMRT